MDAEPQFPWFKDKPNTFRRHLKEDTGPFEDYVRARRLALGESLLKLRRIYLDTKYWLYVRDVYLNRPQKAIHTRIVEELRRLKNSGSTICPVSFSVFIEMMTQSDLVTRRATAEMIDELSDGCTIQPLFEVFRRELYHFVTKSTQSNATLYDIRQMVWTKAAFIVGDMFRPPEKSGFSEHIAIAINKAFDDMLWTVKLSEFIAELPKTDQTQRARAERLASDLTKGKFEHQRKGDTFRKLFLDEIAGVVDVFSDICGDLMVHLARNHGIVSEVSDAERDQSGRMLGNLIRGAFEYNRITTEFPTVSIPAALHASVRMDKRRKFKKGDAEDFHHAALAVRYFDVFLTESSLQHQLRSKPINVEESYNCRVLSGGV